MWSFDGTQPFFVKINKKTNKDIFMSLFLWSLKEISEKNSCMSIGEGSCLERQEKNMNMWIWGKYFCINLNVASHM